MWRTTLSDKLKRLKFSVVKLAHIVPILGLVVSVSLSSCSRSYSGQTSTITVTSTAASPSPSPETHKRSQAQPIDKTWPSKFRFSAHSIDRTHEGLRSYEISADRPYIMNAKTAATRHFNRWMSRKIRGYVKRFESLERAAEIRDRKRRLKKVAIEESLEIGYLVYYSDKRLISLRLTHTVMAVGQMHPIAYYETINYDLDKQRPLETRDVFRPGYLKVFSSYSRKHLRDKYEISDDNWLDRGTSPRSRNFPNWNIVPDGILISFDDYQVSSHSFGQPELIVPCSELCSVLRDTRRTYRCRRNAS